MKLRSAYLVAVHLALLGTLGALAYTTLREPQALHVRSLRADEIDLEWAEMEENLTGAQTTYVLESSAGRDIARLGLAADGELRAFSIPLEDGVTFQALKWNGTMARSISALVENQWAPSLFSDNNQVSRNLMDSDGDWVFNTELFNNDAVRRTSTMNASWVPMKEVVNLDGGMREERFFDLEGKLRIRYHIGLQSESPISVEYLSESGEVARTEEITYDEWMHTAWVPIARDADW